MEPEQKPDPRKVTKEQIARMSDEEFEALVEELRGSAAARAAPTDKDLECEGYTGAFI